MATANKTLFLYLTRNGRSLAERIAARYPGATCSRLSSDVVKDNWLRGTGLVFIMAAGIVVRKIAPFLKDKRTDPAVVVLDEKGEHVVSLLSGHLGGANALAREIASLLHATPVITTASDTNGLPSLDLWAEEEGLVVENWEQLPAVATRLLDHGSIRLFSDIPIDAPDQFEQTDEPASADVVVTNRSVIGPFGKGGATVFLKPKNLVAGVGCNSNTAKQEIEEAVRSVLGEAGLSFLSLRTVATIDVKGNEPGLRAFTLDNGFSLATFTADELNLVPGIAPSEAARKATGAQAVAEPAAILASPGGRLLVGKRKMGNVTVAIAEDNPGKRKSGRSPARQGKGALYVVGTGPGGLDDLTPRALHAIQQSDVIVAYGTYLDLIKGLTRGKETVSTGMAQEIDRCRRAIELARAGRTVSVISGGDPGIYAMAGLVLELLHKSGKPGGPDIPLFIIPGISALNACAARLGAPLMHDFACISLSDRLTPWETIEKRLEAAAMADFVIVLYNPRSKGRPTHINKAQQLILKHRGAGTPVGIVRSASREQERVFVTDLGRLPFDEIDMQTTVIVGNSRSMVWGDFMITPRGYEKKASW
jgi:cobalt-precorrin 5A hydrolase / precorrin-3B C17-methyltransferase